MARLPRLSLAGHPHHVIQRGNDRQAIVRDDQDRERLMANKPAELVVNVQGKALTDRKAIGEKLVELADKLKPGEEIELQHTFLERPRQKTFWERLGL